MPVTSHLTDADKDVLGEALLKSVLAPADEDKPLEVHLTAPPADLRPGSPQRTSRALLTLGVELDGQLVMASLYEKRVDRVAVLPRRVGLRLHARGQGQRMDETWVKGAQGISTEERTGSATRSRNRLRSRSRCLPRI